MSEIKIYEFYNQNQATSTLYKLSCYVKEGTVNNLNKKNNRKLIFVLLINILIYLKLNTKKCLYLFYKVPLYFFAFKYLF
jgi:hypothetical protein